MKRILFFLLLFITIQGFSQSSRIVLDNNARIVISNNAFIVVDNQSPNAITDNSSNCGIISEGENNRVRWYAGTGTGNYSIPFYDEDNNMRIPLSFNISTAGNGSGYIDFSSFDGTTWDNNTYRPSMVTHTQLYFPPSIVNSSDKMIDRFWLLNAQGYTTKPSGNLTFTYIDAEHTAAGNTINESLLSAKRFNSGSAVWSDMLNNGSSNTAANTVSTTNISASDLFAAWTLVDPSCNIGGTLANSNSPLCDGNALNLTASGGTSYSWIGPTSFTSSQQNPVINPADPSASGTYTVIITNDYNCKDTLNVTVVVNSVTADAGMDQPITSGQTANLGASASGGSGNYTYSWSPAASLVDANVQNPQTVNLTVTTTFYVTITDVTTGCTDTDDIIVTVTGSVLSANAASNPTTICQGEVVQLSSNAGGGSGSYTYTWTSAPVGFSSTSASPTDTPLQTTTYYLTVDDGIGTVTSSVTVIVNSVPTATASSNSPVCENKNIELYGNGGATYAWSGPGGYSSTDPSPVIFSALLSDAGTYTVTVTNDLGCTSTASVNVIVEPVPTVSASSNSPVCEGNDINLFVTGGVSWEWTGSASFTSVNQNPVISPATAANAGIYTVIASSAAGCSATTTVDITVNAAPTATASSNSPVCENKSIVLQGGGGSTYNWSGPDSFSSADQNPSISIAVAANAGTYSVTVTNDLGCTSVATVDVVVNTEPVISVSSNSPVCEGGNINLTVTGGVSWNWSGPDSFTSTNQNPVISAVSSVNAGTYSVIVYSAEGCSATGTTDVTMGGGLVVTPTATSPVCEGDTLFLSVSGGITYNWTGPHTWTSTISDPQIISVTTGTGGTYYVTVSDASGCTGTGSVDVVVNPLPSGTVSNNGPLCEGETLLLAASGGTTYGWTGPDSFTSSDAGPSVVNTTINNSGAYIVTITALGCSVELTTTVLINASPAINASSNSPVCVGNTIVFSAIGGGTFSWSGPDGFTSSEQNPAIIDAEVINSGSYTLVVSDINGCSATQSLTVSVNALPVVTCDNNNPDCPGDPVMLMSSGGTVYSWSGPNGFSSSEQNPVILNPTTLYSGIYYVTVSEAAGCSSVGQTTVNYPLPIIITGVVTQNNTDHLGEIDISASGGALPYTFLWSHGATSEDVSGLFSGEYIVILTDAGLCNVTDTFVVDIPLIIPNTITPNADGINDNFEIVNIGAYKDVTLEIYNRWGDLLFRFQGTGAEYASPDKRWDGKHNGKDLPMGSYLYILILDELDPLSGAVMLKY